MKIRQESHLGIVRRCKDVIKTSETQNLKTSEPQNLKKIRVDMSDPWR